MANIDPDLTDDGSGFQCANPGFWLMIVHCVGTTHLNAPVGSLLENQLCAMLAVAAVAVSHGSPGASFAYRNSSVPRQDSSAKATSRLRGLSSRPRRRRRCFPLLVVPSLASLQRRKPE